MSVIHFYLAVADGFFRRFALLRRHLPLSLSRRTLLLPGKLRAVSREFDRLSRHCSDVFRGSDVKKKKCEADKYFKDAFFVTGLMKRHETPCLFMLNKMKAF